jgi:peptide subunit release factor RF-3
MACWCAFKVAICWVQSEDKGTLARFIERNRLMLAKDRDDAYVFLPESELMLRKTIEDLPDVKFTTFRERD